MLWLLVAFLAIDLGTVKNEPNLEKRSELALDYAGTQLTAANEAYGKGNLDQVKSSIVELEASVDLAYDSLAGTGKDARRNPKFFKRAEMSTRQLLRRLNGMMESMSLNDRSLLEHARDRVSEVHDALLTGVMGKRR